MNGLKSLFVLLAFAFIVPLKGSDSRYILAEHNRKVGFQFQPMFNKGFIYNSKIPTPGGDPVTLGINYGILGGLRLSKSVFVEAGVNHGIQRYKHTLSGELHDEITDFFPERIVREDRFSRLSLPVRAVFHSSPNRFRKIASAGIDLGFLLRHSRFDNYEFEEGSSVTNAVKSPGEFAIFQPELRLGVGIEYDLENELSVRIEPFVSTSFFSGKNHLYSLNFWNIGILFTAQLQEY